MHTHIFTSESVTEGHPDKICDQISDAILDACLAQDPTSRVAVETGVKDNAVFLLGELTTKATIKPEAIARQVIRDIGYTDDRLGFSADSCQVHVHLSQQSPDIAQGVDRSDKDIGAGDQGMMFGYADRQTPQFMPLPIWLAHQLTQRLAFVRKHGILPWVRPDGKAQVTIAYEGQNPTAVTTVVVSTQHDEEISLEELREAVQREVVEAVIPRQLVSSTMRLHINPTGRFVIGGPVGDSGVTGRKIIVDTYGGWSRHGGGAFSGKDPTKVDRSAAYAARQAARSVIEADLAERCEIQLAYAIGIAEPVGIYVTTFGTGSIPDNEIAALVSEIDFRPAAIIERLQLRRPLYLPTASYGHFGRDTFPWEEPVSITSRVSSEIQRVA